MHPLKSYRLRVNTDGSHDVETNDVLKSRSDKREYKRY